MNSVLLSYIKLENFLLDGLKGIKFNNTNSQFSFCTCISMIQALEVLKKRSFSQPSVVSNNFQEICESGIYQLELNHYEIVKALEDPEFVDLYTSHATNPFDTALLLSIAYNDNCWGDVDELIGQI